MKHKVNFQLIVALLFCFSSEAQSLLPSITSTQFPLDEDTICSIPWYLGSFYDSGLNEGQLAADFTLYDINGEPFQLSENLQGGKPLLIINGSYTCPVFRNKLPVIEQIQSIYGELLNIIIVYTVEAHPLDTSIYFGYVSTGQANITAGILYNQPTTYGERKEIVVEMLQNLNINVPVYLDDACNNWWSFYGPAPNNSYIILPQGSIYSKHGWFDRSPDRIFCDLDSLLGFEGNCNFSGVENPSFFTFTSISSDTIYGEPNTTITYSARLENTGNYDMSIYVRKLQNNLPLGWGSSLCLDACYSTSTDSVVFLLPAGEGIDFYFYIYTNSQAGEARCRVGFRNMAQPQNSYMVPITGIAGEILLSEEKTINPEIIIYPNPTMNFVNVKIQNRGLLKWKLFNTLGIEVRKGVYENTQSNLKVDFNGLSQGVYYLELDLGGTMNVKRIAYAPK